MVSKLPRKNVKSWKAGNSGLARPLGGFGLFCRAGGREVCWHPNVALFGARSLEVVVWVKECGVAAGVQRLRQQVLLAVGCV